MVDKYIHPRHDPARRRMKLEMWPERDRRAWQLAICDDDPFSVSGKASHWRPGTRKKVVAAYGRWLTFLDRQCLLKASLAPSERITEPALRRYVDELRDQVATTTLSGLITDLCEAVRVMDPRSDLALVKRVQKVLAAQACASRNKTEKIVTPEELFTLGQKIMHEAENGPIRCEDHRSTRFRDGLMIALLAARPIRRKNFCHIRLDENLLWAGNHYRLRFQGHETKNGAPIDSPVPDALTPYVKKYLTIYRPAILKNRVSDRLWVTLLDSDMAEDTIAIRIRRLTQKEFGWPLNMHVFRDCLTTAMAIEDPGNVRAAAPMLGHVDFKTTESHYNQAQCIEAARPYQADLATRRKTIRSLERKRTRARQKE